MSVTPLSDGRFEATVLFGLCDPKHFQFESREEAQELVDAEHIFKMLHYTATRDQCSDAEILAAADAVSRIPCGDDADLSKWIQITSRWIRRQTYEEWPFDSAKTSLVPPVAILRCTERFAE